MFKFKSKSKRRPPSQIPEMENKIVEKLSRRNKLRFIISANKTPLSVRSDLSIRSSSTAPLSDSINDLPANVIAKVSALALRFGVAPGTLVSVAVIFSPIPVVASQLFYSLSLALDSSSFAASRSVFDSRQLA